MKVATTIAFTISAAHRGPFDDRLHGHTYRVKVWIRVLGSPADGVRLKQDVLGRLAGLDHGMLDDVLGRENATAEGLAAHILTALAPGAMKVSVDRDDGPGAEVEL
jgi:6-pyruvoyl-tetrahydropterin synthase